MGVELRPVLRAVGIDPLVTFTSFRHGGLTELGDCELTDARIRAVSRHKSAKVLTPLRQADPEADCRRHDEAPRQSPGARGTGQPTPARPFRGCQRRRAMKLARNICSHFCRNADSRLSKKWSGRRESNPRMQLGKPTFSQPYQVDSCKTERFGRQLHQRVSTELQNPTRSIGPLSVRPGCVPRSTHHAPADSAPWGRRAECLSRASASSIRRQRSARCTTPRRGHVGR